MQNSRRCEKRYENRKKAIVKVTTDHNQCKVYKLYNWLYSMICDSYRCTWDVTLKLEFIFHHKWKPKKLPQSSKQQINICLYRIWNEQAQKNCLVSNTILSTLTQFFRLRKKKPVEILCTLSHQNAMEQNHEKNNNCVVLNRIEYNSPLKFGFKWIWIGEQCLNHSPETSCSKALLYTAITWQL